MKKNILLVIITASLMSFVDESRNLLLTNGSLKSWSLILTTSNSEEIVCDASSPRVKDNNYIFFSDGKLEYDHGLVTEDKFCSDLVNLIGKWELSANESTLKITALYEKSNPNNDVNTILFEGAIEQLDSETMRLKTATGSVEFRKK